MRRTRHPVIRPAKNDHSAQDILTWVEEVERDHLIFYYQCMLGNLGLFWVEMFIPHSRWRVDGQWYHTTQLKLQLHTLHGRPHPILQWSEGHHGRLHPLKLLLQCGYDLCELSEETCVFLAVQLKREKWNNKILGHIMRFWWNNCNFSRQNFFQSFHSLQWSERKDWKNLKFRGMNHPPEFQIWILIVINLSP